MSFIGYSLPNILGIYVILVHSNIGLVDVHLGSVEVSQRIQQ